MEQIRTSGLSVTELKAFAYDQLALIEQCQNNLKEINIELNKRNNAVETHNTVKMELAEQPKPNVVE
jgi:hypothetical protein